MKGSGSGEESAFVWVSRPSVEERERSWDSYRGTSSRTRTTVLAYTAVTQSCIHLLSYLKYYWYGTVLWDGDSATYSALISYANDDPDATLERDDDEGQKDVRRRR